MKERALVVGGRTLVVKLMIIVPIGGEEVICPGKIIIMYNMGGSVDFVRVGLLVF